MMDPAPCPGLDGLTLATIVSRLLADIGWDGMAARVPVRCFRHDPSVKASLKFLRRTPWARAKVEQIYLRQARLNSDPMKGGDHE